jgi:hypothetical protein
VESNPRVGRAEHRILYARPTPGLDSRLLWRLEPVGSCTSDRKVWKSATAKAHPQVWGWLKRSSRRCNLRPAKGVASTHGPQRGQDCIPMRRMGTSKSGHLPHHKGLSVNQRNSSSLSRHSITAPSLMKRASRVSKWSRNSGGAGMAVAVAVPSCWLVVACADVLCRVELEVIHHSNVLD